MNLVIDVGNTRSKVALFEGELLRSMEVIDLSELQNFIKYKPIKHGILSSVRPIEEELLSVWRLKFPLIVLNDETPVPVFNRYGTPKTLGMDRLAAICGARVLLPKSNVLVVDAGTCITYDFLDEQAVYRGGSISPGIDMRFKAMNEFTGALPRLNFEVTSSPVGQNTKESMLSGIHWGVLGEYKQIKAWYTKHYTNLTVLFTGGDALLFEKMLKKKIFAAPNLVLIGLNDILLHNVR